MFGVGFGLVLGIGVGLGLPGMLGMSGVWEGVLGQEKGGCGPRFLACLFLVVST